MSLRFKLLIFFILSTLPPVIVGVYIIFSISSHFLTEKTLEKLQAVLAIEESVIYEVASNFIDTTHMLAQSFAAQIALEDLQKNPPAISKQADMLDEILVQNQHLKNITLFDTDGVSMYTTRRASSTPASRRLAQEMTRLSSGKITNFFKDEQNVLFLRVLSLM